MELMDRRLMIRSTNLEQEFEYLYEYARRLCRYQIDQHLRCGRITSAPDVDDLCHDALVYLLTRPKSRLEGASSAKTVLQSVVKQLLLRHDREERRRVKHDRSYPEDWTTDHLDLCRDVRTVLTQVLIQSKPVATSEPSKAAEKEYRQFQVAIEFLYLGRDTFTLEELAAEIGVTRERARQILEGALRRLRHPYNSRGLWEWTGYMGPTERREHILWQRRVNERYRFWNLPLPYPHAERPWPW